MADANERPEDSPGADAMALAEQAEAEAAEAEALAAAARARARAIRLRNEAQARAEGADLQDLQGTASSEQSAASEPGPPGAGDEDSDTAVTATPETDTAEVTDTGDDAAPVSPSEQASPPEQASPRRRLRVPRISTLLRTAAIVVICGLLGVSGYMIWYHQDSARQRQRAAAFAAAARQGVINMTSLDFKDAKHDVQRVLDSSTGEFRDDFQERADDFTEVVEQSKVVTEGMVNSTAVESMGRDSAVVLVAATSHITNAVGAKQEPRAWRLRVTVAGDAGQLKMSKLEFVP